MKTLILASAAVLTLGLGSAFAGTTDAAQQTQQRVAMNAQAGSTQTGSSYGNSFNQPGSSAYVGGWQPAPPDSNPMAVGD